MRSAPVGRCTATLNPCTLKHTLRGVPATSPSADSGASAASVTSRSPSRTPSGVRRQSPACPVWSVAACRIRPASAWAARSVARPAIAVPVLPNAPVSWPSRAVSDCRIAIRSGLVPSAAAAICRWVVVEPLPNSAVPIVST